MKIVFMGTPLFAVEVLQGLIETYDVCLVVSQPDKYVGRKKILTPTEVKKVALLAGIEVFQPVDIRNDYQRILDVSPDLIVTCAYGQIIPKEVLDCPRLGSINVHGSLLPKFRGGAPIHHALIEGEAETGITVMYMDSKMDSGDIISQKSIKIEDTDNVDSMFSKMSILGRELLLDTLPSIIDGTNKRIPQDESKVSYGFNITREEEHLDFNKPERDVFNQIRGLSSVPGGFALLDDNEIKIYGAMLGNKKYNVTPGTIVEIVKEGFVVATLDGSLVITDVKPFGKKRMFANSFANGYRDLVGKVLK